MKMERFAEVISMRFLCCEFCGPLRISTLKARVAELKRNTFSEVSCIRIYVVTLCVCARKEDGERPMKLGSGNLQ